MIIYKFYLPKFGIHWDRTSHRLGSLGVCKSAAIRPAAWLDQRRVQEPNVSGRWSNLSNFYNQRPRSYLKGEIQTWFGMIITQYNRLRFQTKNNFADPCRDMGGLCLVFVRNQRLKTTLKYATHMSHHTTLISPLTNLWTDAVKSIKQIYFFEYISSYTNWLYISQQSNDPRIRYGTVVKFPVKELNISVFYFRKKE